MDIICLVKNSLYLRWKALSSVNTVPVYFYVISPASTTWGCIVPEILGVIKHSLKYNYVVYFIATSSSAFEALNLFNIGKFINVIDRDDFLQSAGLSFCSKFLSLRVDNSENLKRACLLDSSLCYYFSEIPDFWWPFGDILRCIIHNTEYVHSLFVLKNNTYFLFDKVINNGLDPSKYTLKLTSINLKNAESILPLSKTPRFVLSLREAPAHHGSERDTIPESLERVLAEVQKFTSQIFLIGSSPSSTLSSIIKKSVSNTEIIDYTISSYHACDLHETNNPLLLQTLAQSYLLSTNNIKLLASSGLFVLACASNQFTCFYDSPAIYMQKLHKALFIPRRFSFAPDLSPLQAFVFGLISLDRGDWHLRRLPPSSYATFSAIETLVRHYESDDPLRIFREAVFNPRLLPMIRRYTEHLPSEFRVSSCLFDMNDFGSSLIQDKPGLAIRYA